MLGCQLTLLDEDTIKVITNADILHLTGHSEGARQIKRDADEVVWASRDERNGIYYIAQFNLEQQEKLMEIADDEVFKIIELIDPNAAGKSLTISQIEELWSHTSCSSISGRVAAHGANVYKIICDRRLLT